MRRRSLICLLSCVVLLLTSLCPALARAGQETSSLEQSMSETLDLWREGRYEQLFEHLARRGKTSKEQFVRKMHDTPVRPACCFQKLQDFKVLNERRTEATVYAKVGLEGTANPSESSTREFRLSHEEGIWKMQLKDVLALSGATAKKGKHASHKKYSKKITTP